MNEVIPALVTNISKTTQLNQDQSHELEAAKNNMDDEEYPGLKAMFKRHGLE